MPLWEYMGLWYIVVSLGMGIAAFNKWPKEKWEEEQNRKSKEEKPRDRSSNGRRLPRKEY
jgi:hypothetical protein